MGPRRRLLNRRPRVLKNTAAEADQFRLRAAVAFFFVLIGVVGLGFWYFRLQVWQHDDYAMRSEQNRVKLRPVVPGRGLIYDRRGRILADNVPAFRIEVTPSEAGDSEKWLPQLARVVALTPEDISRFEAERKATRGFKPIVLKLRVSDEEVAAFAVDRWRFPGVELVSYLNRRYPYGELFAHVIGYVGRIDTKDQEALGVNAGVLTHIGKTGLERSYEQQLRGQVGYEQIETNVDGRPIRQVGHVPAKPGADLRLSIDLDLQRAMVTAFGDMDGSAVAVDPRTGEVLAMVSLPSYDSNLFVNGISSTDYKALNEDPSRPQFNRNVLGGGPPGSTMKPFMALAGLDSGTRRAEDKILSTGEFHIPGQKRGYRDSHGGGHGWVDLRESIAQSVNTYYYKLALDMGIQKVDQYMLRYGFGQKTGIDLLGENIGILPSPEWKAKRNKKEGWYPGETVIAGIGQGYWVVTALQLARGTAAIANNGTLRQLHLVREIRTGYESPWLPKELNEPTRITDNPAHLQAVHEGMESTIHGGRGTARIMARGAPYRMAGKTGTAQKVSRKGNVSLNPHSLPYHLRHQALFVGYAPAENPTIAVAVVVEHGGYGGSTAAPIARKIFDAWLLGKMPEAPPSKDGKPAPTVAPLAVAPGAAPTVSPGQAPGEGAVVPAELKVVAVPVNGAWAKAVAMANARVAAQPGHVPQAAAGAEAGLQANLPGYVAPPEQAADGAAPPARHDDALIEPNLDPEDDDVSPTVEPQR
ncbi:penicillin-binding protein 2 [Lysobacter sp. yr284]|uniref:penicillin-binding protein 2 n=1 Tax=Lysobacter sp. yr284 TaxID=1761791 RepID=UPI00089B8DF9|nr:penicillin-binding protein 2 [Lysobacter sp. yr284]SDZ10971.1 penicillin-binding protein 2 [Lysobacter sp. yr284]